MNDSSNKTSENQGTPTDDASVSLRAAAQQVEAAAATGTRATPHQYPHGQGQALGQAVYGEYMMHPQRGMVVASGQPGGGNIQQWGTYHGGGQAYHGMSAPHHLQQQQGGGGVSGEGANSHAASTSSQPQMYGMYAYPHTQWAYHPMMYYQPQYPGQGPPQPPSQAQTKHWAMTEPGKQDQAASKPSAAVSEEANGASAAVPTTASRVPQQAQVGAYPYSAAMHYGAAAAYQMYSQQYAAAAAARQPGDGGGAQQYGMMYPFGSEFAHQQEAMMSPMQMYGYHPSRMMGYGGHQMGAIAGVQHPGDPMGFHALVNASSQRSTNAANKARKLANTVKKTRERKRAHARRSRLRRKMYVESLGRTYEALDEERKKLRSALKLVGITPPTTADSPVPVLLEKPSKQAQNILSAQQYLMLEALRNAYASFILISHKSPHNIVFASNTFYTLFRIKPPEVLGKPLSVLDGPDTDTSTSRKIVETMDNEEELTTVIMHYRNKRDPFWNKVHIAPLRDHQGSIVNYIAIMAKVSEDLARKMHLFDELSSAADRKTESKKRGSETAVVVSAEPGVAAESSSSSSLPAAAKRRKVEDAIVQPDDLEKESKNEETEE